jgi:hypothetical protein
MKRAILAPVLVLSNVWNCAVGQDNPPPEESRFSTRYAVSVIDDATFYGGLRAPIPEVLNQLLVEPSYSVKYKDRWNFSTSLIGDEVTYADTASHFRAKETYAGLSAGDFDLLAGRKMVRWGTGYAFTSAGVLDPPRDPTNPTDRLNTNEGRDMIKADWVKRSHAISAAWSTADFARKGVSVRDTTAFRYNVLVRGFDTSLIAGYDRGSDAFGALTFTRVLGQAWELHGESTWRDGEAILIGGKYTAASGVTFIGEFYSPPNIPYYQPNCAWPSAGRQHCGFLNVSKARLRELPGWKEWDVSGSVVTNFDDRSYAMVFDVSRWFGKHFSSYLHLEIPRGKPASEYCAAPYSTATSVGIRFQL